MALVDMSVNPLVVYRVHLRTRGASLLTSHVNTSSNLLSLAAYVLPGKPSQLAYFTANWPYWCLHQEVPASHLVCFGGSVLISIGGSYTLRIPQK